MQGVILAAGLGGRLGSHTEDRPKCLMEFGGRPLILHQLEHLADHGVGPVLCVLGYHAEAAEQVIGERAEFIRNEFYKETNSLYSFWLARKWIEGPFVLLNSDLLFDSRILDRLLEEPGTVIAYDSTSSRGREQTKIAIKQRRVVDLGKDLPPNSARGESLGLIKFDEAGAKAMIRATEHLVGEGHDQSWVVEAVRSVCSQSETFGVNIAGMPWAEIDFPHDLAVARAEVWPAIWRGRWRKTVYWKRTRWVAAAAVALLFSITGWLAGSSGGTQSIDWDTVAPDTGQIVRIERHNRTQRWWSLELGQVATSLVSGPEALIEVRLVLPPGTADTARYVVGILKNGEPYDWEALTAVADTTAHLEGVTLGDRDRVRIPLPPGEHRLGVTLVAGHSPRLLVRIRQPDDSGE